MQSAAALLAQMRQRWRQEVAKRFAIRATHAAAHLVEVAQSEMVGGINDNGVGVTDVDTILHDGGGDEYVVIVVGKAQNDFLQFGGGHLPMTDSHAGIGHIFLYQFFEVLKRRDAVSHDVSLSVPTHFEINGIGNYLVTKGVYLRLYRASVGRWRLDDAKVARAHQRELQGARNGCGRHGECVYIHFQLAEFLLDSNAKLLFLVDDEKPQVFEFHTFADEFVSAHKDIDFPLGQIGQ